MYAISSYDGQDTSHDTPRPLPIIFFFSMSLPPTGLPLPPDSTLFSCFTSSSGPSPFPLPPPLALLGAIPPHSVSSRRFAEFLLPCRLTHSDARYTPGSLVCLPRLVYASSSSEISLSYSAPYICA